MHTRHFFKNNEWIFIYIVTHKIGINFDQQFLMHDACQASYNAAQYVFPDAAILKCYFHVLVNVTGNI